MNYRADIDGLRAIAIVFVLFFHAGLTVFPSGFIGVDIFFVISGFLITGIINTSLNKNRFSFSEFYNRRLWRLQPVFLCLIFCTALCTVCFFLPEDVLQYFKSARKSSIFISNMYFERLTTDYFARHNKELPLLHTWSLSIEWQCYLMLPIAFYALKRFCRPQHTAQIIYLLTVIFLFWTLYSSIHNPTKSYYQLLSRIFEFLIGSCVAITPPRKARNKYILNLIALFALFTMFYIASLSHIAPGFPNQYALILCTATATLIALGQYTPKPIINQLLALKPIVFVGLISYSLYIWHWPLFALMHYLQLDESSAVLLLVFSLVFIVAYLSWRFIEQPAQQFKTLRFGYSFIYLLLIPILLIHLSDSLMKHYEGYPQRFRELAQINTQLKHYAYAQRPLCLDEKNIPVDSQCVLGAKKSVKKAFMLGDSYSNHFWGFIDTLAKQAHTSVLAHATAACLALPGISLKDWNGKEYIACHKQTRRYMKMIRDYHFEYVIIGQNWNGYLVNKINSPMKADGSYQNVQETIEQALDKALALIYKAGSKPILIKSIAQVDKVYDCFYTHIKKHKKYDPHLCNYLIKPEDQMWQDALFARLKSKYPQLIIIDPKIAQCPEGLCTAAINGIPVFRDAGHITDYAATQWAKIYLKATKNPLTLS